MEVISIGREGFDRDLDPYLRAFVDGGHDADGSPRQPRPLGDAHQPQARALPSGLEVETLAIVAYHELGAFSGAAQTNPGLAGLCVLDDVVQRFLCHPVETERG